MARIPTARYDRQLTIQQPVRVRDPKYGTYAITWQNVATVWAEVKDSLPSRAESFADGIEMSQRPCRVRIRYRDDIRTDMRLLYRGRTLRIMSMAEYGRRDAIELMAVEFSTEGTPP